MRRVLEFLVRAGFVPAALCVAVLIVDIQSQWALGKVSLGGWYFIVKESLCWGLMFGALPFFLGKWSRWLLLPALLFILGNGIVESYVKATFDMNYTGDWIMVLQATSMDELLNYWGENAGAVVGGTLVLLLSLVGLAWGLRKARYPRISVKSLIVGLILLLPMYVLVCRGQLSENAFRSAIFHKVISETCENFGMMRDIGVVHGHPEGLENVRLSVPLEDAPTCAIVIGESATRNNFGIYGYARDTTPCLSSVSNELYVFTDVVSAWHSTMLALRYLFTGATCEDKAHARMLITQAVKKAGYRQTFITNVSRIGAINNVIQHIFDAADEMIYLHELNLQTPFYDDAMLPYFGRTLAAIPTNGQVIYQHQNGSHYPYYPFYPKSKEVYSHGTTIDHYDNTVRLTDFCLGETIKSLKTLHRPALMFYISDHGETPRAKSWRAYNDRDLWEVPMIVWFSDEYVKKFPETVARVRAATSLPLQSDQVLPVLLEMMQIRGWADTESERNFLDPSFVPRRKRMIKEWSEEYRRR